MHYEIPQTSNEAMQFDLVPGETLYITGANGSGKSALLLELLSQSGGSDTRWLSARRQVHLSAVAGSSGIMNYVHLDYRRDSNDRQNIFENKLIREFMTDGRWQEQEAEDRLTKPLFELVTRENERARTIANSLDSVDRETENEIPTPPASPIRLVNDVLSKAGLMITLKIGPDGKLLSVNREGVSYDLAQASDGERGAVIAAATVVTAPEGAVILIDEPDRHLHRSVLVPFMSALTDSRNDCAFIVATYETALLDTHRNARTLVVESCTWSGDNPTSWDVTEIGPGESLPEEVRAAVLGAREKIIFVEGGPDSLDYRLYSILFPNAVIRGIGGHGDVESAVRSLRQNNDHTRIEAFGIVDGDGRSEELTKADAHTGIYVLDVYCIECLYFCEEALEAVAKFKAPIVERSAEELVGEVKDSVLARLASEDTVNQMAARRAWSQIKASILGQLPSPEEIRKSSDPKLTLEVSSPFQEEVGHYRQLLCKREFGKLMARYPVHQTNALNPVHHVLKLRNRDDYADTLLYKIRQDHFLAQQLRNRMGSWAETMTTAL